MNLQIIANGPQQIPLRLDLVSLGFEVNPERITPEKVVWKIIVNDAPVLPGDKSFSMPGTITSTAIPTDVFVPTLWSFTAQYSNDQKLAVTSRVMPILNPKSPR